MHELEIEARGLTKRFGKVVALDDLDLAVERGASLAILGPTGSGKSVALRLLAGLVRPSRGSVTIGGLDPAGRAGIQARRRIGYAAQEPAFYEWMTGRELLAFAADLQGIERRAAPDAVAVILERVGLADLADRRIADYSLTLRRRLNIGQAMLGRPAVLLLDEALDSLDADGGGNVLGILRGFRGEGTCVVATADVAIAEAVADRVALLDGGSLIALGPSSEVLARGGPQDYVIETAPGAGLALAGLMSRLEGESWVRSAIAREGLLRVAIREERAEHELLPAVVATGLTIVSLRRERPGVDALVERIRRSPA